jgi:hypothetical protein
MVRSDNTLFRRRASTCPNPLIPTPVLPGPTCKESRAPWEAFTNNALRVQAACGHGQHQVMVQKYLRFQFSSPRTLS